MAGAVHVERKVRALVDNVVYVAVLIGLKQSEVQQALRQHAHCGVMWVCETRAGFGGCYCRILAREY